MNLTIAELNEALYLLRMAINYKPELINTDVAQSVMDKIYNELENRVDGVIQNMLDDEVQKQSDQISSEWSNAWPEKPTGH